MYRCEALSISGFVQQLAVSYLTHGYFFYVTGFIPEGKDPRVIDQKLIEKYGIDRSKWARARQKEAGYANMQYLRHQRFFVLLATHGHHRFFQDEARVIQDARKRPIKFAGYAISVHSGHAHVRIGQKIYQQLKSYLLSLALHRSGENIEAEFRKLHYEPYAPVRRQLLSILRAVNDRRRSARYEPLRSSCVRLRRRIVRPFDDLELGGSEHAIAVTMERGQKETVTTAGRS